VNIFNSPALYLLVAAAIGYVLPLVSARVAKAHWNPEVEGILTLVFSTITGLAAELIHAGTTAGVDFSWRAWAATAFTTLLTALVGQSQTWRGSATAAKLRAAGSVQPANMHTDGNPPA
jgi:hypothetical protein